ncbi:MAG TPA: CrcB family protein [Sporichthyaceae bacterium]|jgi:CrcB protein|nr:CrcB family protein [Sporichthyaceae bacterium]
MNWLLVAIGAAVGAPARYLTDRALQRLRPGPFPIGTFVVNVFASLALGLVVGSQARGGACAHLVLLVGTGFCGALSTYSTFSWETLRLAEEGHGGLALANGFGSVALGLLAAVAGVMLGHQLT